jgi:hypothetical protein
VKCEKQTLQSAFFLPTNLLRFTPGDPEPSLANRWGSLLRRARAGSDQAVVCQILIFEDEAPILFAVSAMEMDLSDLTLYNTSPLKILRLCWQ